MSDALRERILGGEWPDDSPLPARKELGQQFQVSPPALRGALVILETEGLVASHAESSRPPMVRRPDTTVAAYGLSLLLQSRQAPLDDIAAAFEQLEPLCAAICAERDDRGEALVPALRDLTARSLDSLDDPDESYELGRRFHAALVEGSGNQTLTFLVGVLRSVWRAHLAADPSRPVGPYPDRAQREAAIASHVAVVDRLAAGDARGARQTAREHVRLSHQCGREAAVRASALRPLIRPRIP